MAEKRPPTLRFWGWAAPAVVIGRFQSLQNEVDFAAASAMGVTVVRRTSGGGAMFVQPNRTITYSLYLPERLVGGLSIKDSYAACDAWAVAALRELGVDCRYVPINDIAAPDGKIGGAAQTRRQGWVLHHTTIAYELDADEMKRVLRFGLERRNPRGTPSAVKHVSPLRRHMTLSRFEVVDHLIARFGDEFGVSQGALGRGAVEASEKSAAERFGTPQWTAEIP
jgi:lipoate-protein ligase A